MLQAPAEVLDRIGEARTVLAGTGRGVRPAAGALGGVLNAHRQVEPVEDMKDRSGARGLSQRSRAVCAVAQACHLRIRRHAETTQHAVQLRGLLVGLTGDAAEADQLSIVIADLGGHHLECPALVAMPSGHARRRSTLSSSPRAAPAVPILPATRPPVRYPAQRARSGAGSARAMEGPPRAGRTRTETAGHGGTATRPPSSPMPARIRGCTDRA